MAKKKKQQQNVVGRALMKSRFAQSSHVNPDGSIRHTTDLQDSSAPWTHYQSITQESDLEAFLTTAQLAGTEFTAGKASAYKKNAKTSR